MEEKIFHVWIFPQWINLLFICYICSTLIIYIFSFISRYVLLCFLSIRTCPFIHWSINSVSIHEETLAQPRRHCSNKLLCKVLVTNTADNTKKDLTFSIWRLFHCCTCNAWFHCLHVILKDAGNFLCVNVT